MTATEGRRRPCRASSRRPWTAPAIRTWADVVVPTAHSNDGGRSAPLRVSNDRAVLPSGLRSVNKFLDKCEARRLVRSIDGLDVDDRHDVVGGKVEEEEEEDDNDRWMKEGFERKRRVQRYSAREEIERKFGWVIDRLVSVLGGGGRVDDGGGNDENDRRRWERPNDVLVEELRPGNVNRNVTTFESSSGDPCSWCADPIGEGRGGGEGEDGGGEHKDRRRCRGCYVAQLTLLTPAVQSINKPLRERDVECWDLASPDHDADVRLEPNGILVKTGEALWDWRCRVEALGSEEAKGEEEDGGAEQNAEDEVGESGGGGDRRCIVVHFRCIRASGDGAAATADEDDGGCRIPPSLQQGKVSSADAPVDKGSPMPPLSELLTIIVTTSPIKSNPSTELLERTFDAFRHAGDEFAYACPKVIVCDGCRVLERGDADDNSDGDREEEKKEEGEERDLGKERGGVETDRPLPPVKAKAKRNCRKVSRKHANTKQALRNGIATADQAENYRLFKLALRRLCEEVSSSSSSVEPSDATNDDKNDEENTEEPPSPFGNTTVVELETRHGYGFALRHALLHHVSTKYVCVIQHDRTFMRTTPLESVVRAMWNDPERRIKYVGMSMRSNLMYRDIFVGKYGRAAHEELGEMVLRPPELALNALEYGPGGSSARGFECSSDKMRNNIRALADAYHGSTHGLAHAEWLEESVGMGASSIPGNETTRCGGRHQLTLTPTLFWYDNTHVCETTHYRDFVFDPKKRMVARGGFVEDKLSPLITRSVERLGLREGHAKFGCYLLDDHSGTFFTGHLDGGSYLTAVERRKFLREGSSSGSLIS